MQTPICDLLHNVASELSRPPEEGWHYTPKGEISEILESPRA
jgi:hypothetical protein